MKTETKVKIGLVAVGGVSLFFGGPALFSGMVVVAKIVAPAAALTTCIVSSYAGAYYMGKYRERQQHQQAQNLHTQV